jgi:hypothetical protein
MVFKVVFREFQIRSGKDKWEQQIPVLLLITRKIKNHHDGEIKLKVENSP